MPRKLEAQLAGRYLMSSVLMTSTMKSEPATPPIRLLSACGVPTSAAMDCAVGGSAEGSLLSAATVASAIRGAAAPAAPAIATPVKNLRRSTFEPDPFEAGILRTMMRPSIFLAATRMRRCAGPRFYGRRNCSTRLVAWRQSCPAHAGGGELFGRLR